MVKDTETIDRLFLELSHFTSAKTAKERQLENQVSQLMIQTIDVCNLLWQLARSEEDDAWRAMKKLRAVIEWVVEAGNIPPDVYRDHTSPTTPLPQARDAS